MDLIIDWASKIPLGGGSFFRPGWWCSQNFRNGGINISEPRVIYSVLGSILEMWVNWVKISAPSSKYVNKKVFEKFIQKHGGSEKFGQIWGGSTPPAPHIAHVLT